MGYGSGSHHGNRDGSWRWQGVDFHDFLGILVLLVVNSTISFIEENNASNAAATLMARLALKAKQIKYREGVYNLLVLLTGGIPIVIQIVLSITIAIGSYRLFEQGAITKRKNAIKEMARMI